MYLKNKVKDEIMVVIRVDEVQVQRNAKIQKEKVFISIDD